MPPASDHELTVSPVAVRAGAVYGWLTFPSGSDAVVTTIFGFGAAPGLTLIVNSSSDASFRQVGSLSYVTVRKNR